MILVEIKGGENFMDRLSKLPNIGNVMEQQLNEVGITTKEQLQEIGSKAAWLRIKEIDASACYNRLCALEGAIQGVRWHNLEQSDKSDLKKFYNENK